MGCFFGCFRVKDKERPRGVHFSTAALPSKSREHLIANNRSQSGRLQGSSQEIGGSSPLLEALSECTDLRTTENLCLRKGNIKWARQLIIPAEDSAVQKPEDSPKSQSPQSITVHTPLSNATKARNLSEKDETKKFNDEVKYLKSCGTLMRTPAEVREASERHKVSSEDEKNLRSNWHSWFPPPPPPPASEISKIDWDDKPNQVPTPPAYLHEELCEIPTPNLPLHIPKQLSTRFAGEMPQNINAKQDAPHFEGKEGEDEEVDSISTSAVSSAVSEDERTPTIVTPNSSKTLVPTVERPPRYEQYHEIAEEEGDSLSDTGSFASLDSAVKNETLRSKMFDSPARDEPQTPLLFQSNYFSWPTSSRDEPQTPPLFISDYSPQPTPLKLTDDMHTPWTGCPKVLENAGVNKNARFRSQYVYPVLNPVENLSQWKALKKGNSKEFSEQKNHPWAEGSVENQSVIASQAQISLTNDERIGSRGALTDSGIPKVPCGYSTPRVDYTTKENFPFEEEIKLMDKNLDVIDEASQKRKLAIASTEPFYKLPKSIGQFHLNTEESRPAGALHVDSSLSHWLKPTVEESKARWSPLMKDVSESDVNQHDLSVVTQNSEVAMAHNNFDSLPLRAPSTSSLEVSQMQNLQSSKNIDDRPILGALSIGHLQSISPGRSPSSKSGDDDRPILGTVAAHWNDIQTASPKWWDGKGIPNSTNKYKEDQKVSWHSTPFEERLERALSNEGDVSQRKLFNGKPINFEECEESDTAVSRPLT